MKKPIIFSVLFFIITSISSFGQGVWIEERVDGFGNKIVRIEIHGNVYEIKRGANLRNANLSGANLGGLTLNESNLSGANLSGANLSRTDLSKANLSGANLREANLSGAKLGLANLGLEADLSGANLSGAELPSAVLYGGKLEGADFSRADLRLADLRLANLSGAKLSGAKLGQAQFNLANLREANLSGANLSETNLFMADLREADLRGAYLYGANLSSADLSGANLSGANLIGANFDGTKLSGADLTDITRPDPILDPIISKLEAQLAAVSAERDAAIAQRDAAITERDARPTAEALRTSEAERNAVLADVKLAYDEVVGRKGAAEEDLVEVTPIFMANTFDLLWTNSEDNQDTISMVMEFPEDTVTNPPSIAFEPVKGSVLTINYKGSITTVNEPDIVFRSFEEVDFSQDLIDQLSDFNLFSVSIPDEGSFNGIAPFTVAGPNGSRFELTSMKMKMNVNDESKYSFLELEPFTEIFSSLSSKIAELEQGGGGQNLEQVLEQVTDARAGSVVINSSNGEVIVSFNIEESEDLKTWQATGEKITKTIQLKDGKKFYRFALDE